jgi:hypothetical protein
MLASALSITSRLMRHNWRRGGTRSEGQRRDRRIARSWAEDQAAARNNPVILLALLVLLAMLANRETLPLRSLGCVGMYSVTGDWGGSEERSCYTPSISRIEIIKDDIQRTLELVQVDFSEPDFDNMEELLFDDGFGASADDPF